MRVLEISMVGVMTHAHTTVTLPRQGIVLVTGANGAGKSSLLEAVSVGGWEEPLRRKPIWSAPKASIALTTEVGTDRVLIVRSRTKNKSALEFSMSKTSLVNDVPVIYENKTKAQAALERVIGNHMLWRRTSVFSSSDADHFTLATDGERKKLLEDILGLERFDAAHDAASKDKRDLAAKVAAAISNLALLTERVVSSKNRLADARQRLQELPEAIAVSAADLTALDQAGEAAASKASVLSVELDVIKQEYAALEHDAKALAKRADRVVSLAECTLCGQEISHKHQKAVADAAKAQARAVEPVRAALATKVAELREALREANESELAIREQRGTMRSELRAAQALVTQRTTAEKNVRRLQEYFENAADAADEARASMRDRNADLLNLTAAEKVLSLTGVRSYLLGQALAGIEEVANSWLARVAGGGLSLKLQPYSEKASGGVKDSISLEVEGAGGGHGYRAASGGERRRIDIALMLALAEVAEAAVGVGGNTLFFDEVFDALDGDGVDAACAVLDELASDRCVVVISHNTDLAARLNITKHITVDKGVIS